MDLNLFVLQLLIISLVCSVTLTKGNRTSSLHKPNCFAANFTQKNNENLIIWDADTIIIKKIEFFKGDKSIKYGNFFEFHKAYYITNKHILKILPNYHISFLNQFIAISKSESDFLLKNYLNFNPLKKEFAFKISEHILSFSTSINLAFPD